MTITSLRIKRIKQQERAAIKSDYNKGIYSMRELAKKYERSLQFIFEAVHNTDTPPVSEIDGA